jgi:hypothetical protein
MKVIKVHIDKDSGCGVKISGDMHIVPDDLESMDPEEAYGIGHEAGQGGGHEDHKCGGCSDKEGYEGEIDEGCDKPDDILISKVIILRVIKSPCSI